MLRSCGNYRGVTQRKLWRWLIGNGWATNKFIAQAIKPKEIEEKDQETEAAASLKVMIPCPVSGLEPEPECISQGVLTPMSFLAIISLPVFQLTSTAAYGVPS